MRFQFRFWLDRQRPDENELIEYITELKQKRRFSKTIRDGLRLMRDLHNRKTDVLLELFPWLEDQLRPQTDRMMEQFVQSMQRRGISVNDEWVTPAMLRRAVDTEDFQLEVKKAETDGRTAAENFLRAMNALNPPKGPKPMDVPDEFEEPDFDDLSL